MNLEGKYTDMRIKCFDGGLNFLEKALRDGFDVSLMALGLSVVENNDSHEVMWKYWT